MRNNFDIDVCFGDHPIPVYEWENHSSVLGIKATRVSTKFLNDVLTFQGRIVNPKGKIMLISDTKEAVALKLDKDGKILKRSFLSFDRSLDVCEYAYNLKDAHLEFEHGEEKVKYPKSRSIEEEIKDYIYDKINSNKDEDFKKYIWFLYSKGIEGYSQEKLLKMIKSAPLEENMELYKLLES